MASIEKRGENNYRITCSIGYSKGKKIRKHKNVKIDPKLTEKQKEKELQRLSALFEDEVKKGIYFEPSKYTISDFISKWLDERRNVLENKTLYRYEGMLKGRITKSLGHLKLEQVKPLHLLEFYNNLQEKGIRDDTTYTATAALNPLIESKGMKLEELASKAQISINTLKRVLTGKPTSTAKKICKALEIKSINNIFVPTSEPMSLSNKTIQHHHRLLSVMFEDAVRWGLIKENPCSKVQPPKVKAKEMSCLDEDGIKRVFNALESEPIKHKALIILTLVSGCRRGEICALQWKHIDIENNTIFIQQSAEYTPATGLNIKGPKTNSSIRKISIPESAINLLKQYRKWQLEQKVKIGDMWQKAEKEKQGDAWKDPEWVFTTSEGYLMHPDTITDTFKKFMKRHNLPNIRLHDLRHTAATMLIHAGLNVRAVATRMGHANPNVTLAVYSHTLHSTDKQAADLMENLIPKKEENQLKEA